MMIVRFGSTFQNRVAEWLLTAVLLSWGFLLALEPDLFKTNEIYSGFASIAQQPKWAVAALIIGSIRLAALIINGTLRSSPHVRALMAFLSCFFWFLICIGLLNLPNASTGLAIYPWFLVLDMYSTYRAMSDARESDEKARAASRG